MSLVQAVVNDNGYVGNASTTPIVTTTHNLLIAAVGDSGGPVTAINDTYGNAWTAHPDGPISFGGANFYVWYCLDIVGGSGHTVTFTDATGGQKSCIIAEYSGRSKTSIGGHSAVATGNGTTQTGNVVSASAGDDIFAVCMQVYKGSTTTSWTAGSGFAIPANGFSTANPINMPAAVESANAVSAGSYTPVLISTYANNGAFFVLTLPQSVGAALAGSGAGLARASGALSSTPAPFAQILLNNPSHAGGSDMINMGSGPNTQTGDSAYVAFPKLIQWAADLNTMMSQLYPARSVQTPTTGFSIAPAPGVTLLVLNPAGTLAAGTIQMPPTPGDNQTFTVITSQTITAATFNANAGQTLNGAPSTLPANTCVEWIYVTVLSTWFRLR